MKGLKTLLVLVAAFALQSCYAMLYTYYENPVIVQEINPPYPPPPPGPIVVPYPVPVPVAPPEPVAPERQRTDGPTRNQNSSPTVNTAPARQRTIPNSGPNVNAGSANGSGTESQPPAQVRPRTR